MTTSTAISGTRPSVRTGVTANGTVPVPALDWANGQEVTVGSSSAASTVFDAANDRLVEISSNTNCWYTVAASPTATVGAGSQYLAAGAMRYIYVPAGCKIAVLQDSASGAIGMVPALISS